MTGAAFKAYVEQFLVPTLFPDDVVVLDNLAAHKVDGVAEAIASYRHSGSRRLHTWTRTSATYPTVSFEAVRGEAPRRLS